MKRHTAWHKARVRCVDRTMAAEALGPGVGWVQGEAGDINSNVYKASPTQFNLGRVLEMQVRGRRCSACDSFRAVLPDPWSYTPCPRSWPEGHTWEPF